MLILIVRGGTGIVAARAVHQDVAGAEVGKHLLVHLLQGLSLQYVGLVALADIALGPLFSDSVSSVFSLFSVISARSEESV